MANGAAGLIGLSFRAGKMVIGAQAVRDALRTGKAHLVLVDGGASENTRKEFTDACAYRNVDIAALLPGLLGEASGRPGRMVAAVTDSPLANGIRKSIQKHDKTNSDTENAGVH